MIKISEYKQAKKDREKILKTEENVINELKDRKDKTSDKFWKAEGKLQEQKNKE